MIKLPFSNSLFFKNNNYYQQRPQNISHSIQHTSNMNDVPFFNEPKEKGDTVSAPFSLDIFGFKLELDDLIILGLLYFLYSEGVEDEFLYIILFLLLLS